MRLLLLLLAFAFSTASLAQSSAARPFHAIAAKSEAVPAFVTLADAIEPALVALEPIDPSLISEAQAANALALLKAHMVGVGRVVDDPVASASSMEWTRANGGSVARWEVSSPGAVGLRVELAAGALPRGFQVRFAGSADPSHVYGPFTADDFYPDSRTFWSPVLDGSEAIVELFVPAGEPLAGLSLGITRVSHLFESPTQAKRLSEIGASAGCSPDLVCESAGNAALANVGKSVAKMLFTLETGGSALCTGTLIGDTSGSNTPYFYSAAHCIASQSVASSLTTYWFFDRASCGGPNPTSVTQRTGAATLLYRNATSDVVLLQLGGNGTPPAGAWFAGWDATTIALLADLTGIHHPRGDLKKISRARMDRYEAPSGYGSMIVPHWISGVTEPGSSGSGLFTSVGSPAAEYRLRGGLLGGTSECGAPDAAMYDYYSRLDVAYTDANFRKWIDPPPPPNNTLGVTRAGGGTGTVTSSPAGINCGATCSAAFTPGSAVTLAATPTGGSVFGGWGGACSGSGACVVTLDSGKSVSALFNPPGAGATLTVSKSGTGGGTVTSSQGGINCGATCSADLDGGLAVSLYPAAEPGSTFTGWSGACAGIAPCTITMDRAQSVTASFATGGTPFMVNVAPGTIGFGGQSMGTTSPATPLVVMNVGSGTVVFNGVATSDPQFVQAGNCTNIGPGMACTINTSFKPAVTSIALGQSAAVTGQLTLNSNAAGSPHAIALSGAAERSLVTHYYRSILRRAPDAGGKAFWEAEAQRLAGLGINVNEAWYAMAQQFYGSAEYAAFNRGNAAFVTDLYNTFFNRVPDGAGLSYWNSEIFNGLPRGVALASFMFSPEFRAFSQGVFGGSAVRPEIDTVVDFYRGLLGRLPDSGGFSYWIQRFRAAQCSGPVAVAGEVEAISSAFASSGEYGARARTDALFVGDLYNAFLRRGGDRAGVQFWINQVAVSQTRDQLRGQFKNSAEFQARMSAIAATSCIP